MKQHEFRDSSTRKRVHSRKSDLKKRRRVKS
jgi:hypothetical protein